MLYMKLSIVRFKIWNEMHNCSYYTVNFSHWSIKCSTVKPRKNINIIENKVNSIYAKIIQISQPVLIFACILHLNDALKSVWKSVFQTITKHTSTQPCRPLHNAEIQCSVYVRRNVCGENVYSFPSNRHLLCSCFACLHPIIFLARRVAR